MFVWIGMGEGKKIWICSSCKRAYPHTLRFCPKCNISKKHATRLIDTFINSENKLNTIKGKHQRFIDRTKKIQKRHEK